MLVKKIAYTDYDGNKREEDFYFNLNKAELFKWLQTDGDYTLDKKIEQLTRERNGRKIMQTFEELIVLSYGEKSLDGKQFVKSDELTKGFQQTEAYSELFMELVTDAQKAAAFIKGIIPPEIGDEFDKIAAENPEGIPDELKDYIPKVVNNDEKKTNQ